MKIDIKEINDYSARFVISDVDYSFVNALRRTLITDVPKMAIEEVEIHLGAISDENGKTYESTTPLFDEIIAHRLGLVPIPTDLELMTYKDECTCGGEGCVNCSIMYSLNKRGPCTVYSGDIEPLGDDKLKPRDDKIPLLKLTKDEGILIYATAILGTGRTHAKWQVAHGVSYKFYPTVKIDPKKCDHGGICLEYCPVNVLERKGDKVVVAAPENCTLCNSCAEVCELNAIEIGHEENKFIFKMETDGSLFAKEALLYALKHLEASFEDIVGTVDNMKMKKDEPLKIVKKQVAVEVEAAEDQSTETSEDEKSEDEPQDEEVTEEPEEKPKKAKKTAKKATKKGKK